VCENHFVVAIEHVTKSSSLSPDVVGATFMAAGSSAPELFASLMGVVFKDSKDVGVGTVVGSTVFNMLIIVGVSILVSPGQEILVSGRSMMRDGTFYFCSLLILVGFMADGLLSWTDSFIMVIFYMIYIVTLLNWQRIKHIIPKCMARCGCCGNVENIFSDEELNKFDDLESKTKNPTHDKVEKNDVSVSSTSASKKNNQDELDVDAEQADMSPPPSSDTRFCVLATKMFFCPFENLFKYTIPEIQGDNQTRLIGSFVASLLWLFVLVFLMIEWAEKTGCLLNISETVMGLTVTAIGTSAPDALSSFITAKNGKDGKEFITKKNKSSTKLFLFLFLNH